MQIVDDYFLDEFLGCSGDRNFPTTEIGSSLFSSVSLSVSLFSLASACSKISYLLVLKILPRFGDFFGVRLESRYSSIRKFKD